MALGPLGLILGVACGDNLPPTASGPLDLAPITDINPAADIVEVNLVATLGQTTYLGASPADIWGCTTATSWSTPSVA